MAEQDEDDIIKKAKPKRGLKTGSLQGASGLSKILSIEEQVAGNYEDDLSGKNGPLARLTAMREIITANIEEHNQGSVVSSADGSALTGFGQFKTLKAGSGGGKNLPPLLGPAPVPLDRSFWAINIDPISQTEFFLSPNGAGVILPGTMDKSLYYPIEDVGKTWEAQINNILYLETTKNQATGDVEIALKYERSDDIGSGDLSNYLFATDESDNQFMSKYFYPLYLTVADPPFGRHVVIPQGGALSPKYLQRLVPDASLQINTVFYRSPSSTQAVASIDFSPSFAAAL